MATKQDDLQYKGSLELPQHQALEAVQKTGSREALVANSPIFDTEALELLCRRALRQLADHLERDEITGSLWNFQGNGMVQDWQGRTSS